MSERLRSLLTVAVLAAALSGAAAVADTITLEPAPGDLGELRSDGFLNLTADGKDIYLFDSDVGEVRVFREASGAAWGKAIRLNGTPSAPALDLAADSGQIALTYSAEGLYVYGLDGALEGRSELFFTTGVERGKGGWIVSLINLPHPRGGFVGRDQFGEDVPRVVTLDSDLEPWHSGLAMDKTEAITASVAAGRQLRLAAAGEQIYAAEAGNYRIYELSKRLELRSTMSDPELFREASEDGGSLDIVRSDAERFDATKGKEVGGGESGPPATTATAFTFGRVIRDIAWLSEQSALLVLVEAGIDGDRSALDLLDPLTGKGRRYTLRGGTESPLQQVDVGHRYVWVRSKRGGETSYRIDKLDLVEGGREVELEIRQ